VSVLSPPAPQASVPSLDLRACRTGLPVTNAQKAVASTGYVVNAPGFIQPRVVPFGATTDYLWEDDVRLPYSYVLDLVYEHGALYRPTVTEVAVVSYLSSRRERAAVQQGIEIIAEADGNIRWYQVEEGVSASMIVKIIEDPEHPIWKEYPQHWALAVIEYRGYVIVGGEVHIRDTSVYWGKHLTRAIAHELGHHRGLWHAEGGMMGSPDPVLSFSDREREVMRNMFRRQPGTRPPDDSSGLPTASSHEPVVKRVVCAW
jgi:hypothetical protein